MFLSALGPETIAVFIPIIALMIPIVALLVKHQQTMAQIIHGRTPGGEDVQRQLHEIHEQIGQLRYLVNQHTIALDDIRTLAARNPDPTAPSAPVS